MRPRHALLPIAAVLIFGSAWLVSDQDRQRRDAQQRQPVSRGPLMLIAPSFELQDQHGGRARLSAHLGRSRAVVVFYDGEAGADADPHLRQLAEHYEQVRSTGARVFAISLATPYANRQAEERFGHEFPFPLLSDYDRQSSIPGPTHRRWGRWDDDRDKPWTGLFLIDRHGRVAHLDKHVPKPVSGADEEVQQLTQGIWPDIRRRLAL